MKTAKWIPRDPKNDNANATHYCSNCKAEVSAIKTLYYKFCPECGRYMGGEHDRKYMACDHLNDNLVWVTPAVYERFENNPKEVFIEAQGKPIMRLKVTGVGK